MKIDAILFRHQAAEFKDSSVDEFSRLLKHGTKARDLVDATARRVDVANGHVNTAGREGDAAVCAAPEDLLVEAGNQELGPIRKYL